MNKRHFLRQVYEHKSLGRILFNEKVAANCRDLRGTALDLAGGGSYLRYLPKQLHVVQTNIKVDNGVTQYIDFNKQLPMTDACMDAVFLFGALYIAENVPALLSEIRRVLKPGGKFFLATPFIANEMPEPHDFYRFTYEGLDRVLCEAGFRIILIERMGDRFSAAANLLHPAYFFNTVRLFFYTVSLLLDRAIPAGVKTAHPAPMGYFVTATK